MASLPRSRPSSAGLAEIGLGRSRLVIVSVAAVHIAAALPALLLPLPAYVAGSWLLLIGFSCGLRLLRQPIRSIRQLPDGRWRLSLGEQQIDAELHAWFAHPWCCVALFRSGWRFRRAVIVPGWLVAPEVHRRLRVALRATP
jgi:hypothetical protein